MSKGQEAAEKAAAETRDRQRCTVVEANVVTNVYTTTSPTGEVTHGVVEYVTPEGDTRS